MGEYNMDMSSEKKPNIKKLLAEGKRNFEILNAIDQVSKKGNKMIVFTIKDIETQYEEDIYCITESGKRWNLKNILTACGVKAGEDGVYDWSKSDVIGKKITGDVSHEPNEYINREGVTVKGTQHRISDFIPCGWDE